MKINSIIFKVDVNQLFLMLELVKMGRLKGKLELRKIREDIQRLHLMRSLFGDDVSNFNFKDEIRRQLVLRRLAKLKINSDFNSLTGYFKPKILNRRW